MSTKLSGTRPIPGRRDLICDEWRYVTSPLEFDLFPLSLGFKFRLGGGRQIPRCLIVGGFFFPPLHVFANCLAWESSDGQTDGVGGGEGRGLFAEAMTGTSHEAEAPHALLT